jgi:formiminotetrahydrofolate cyclodeaminase
VSVALDIARACSQDVALVQAYEIHLRGTTLLDVGAAAHMARAAARSALDIAEHNLDMVSDSNTKESLRVEITRLRATAA